MKYLGKIQDNKDLVTKEYVDGRSGVTGVKGNSESSYRTGNVNITAANTGAIPANSSGNTQNLARPTKLNGLNDNTLDSKINTLRANRLAFLPADQIIIEKTTDGGTTWVDAGVADSTKTGLFSETRVGVNLPLLNGVKSLLCGIRITFTAMKYNVPSGTAETAKYNYWNSNYIASTERYNQLKEMYFWVSTISDTMGIKVQRATGAAPTNWVTIFDDSSFLMTGWSGCNYLRFSQGVFGGGTDQTYNYWNYRITLMTKGTTASGGATLATTYTTSAQSVMEIRAYGDTWWNAGNEYAANDKIYTHDYLKNVTFPAKVTATGGFSGNLTGNVTGNATNVTGTVAVANGGTGKTTVTDAANNFLSNLPAWTANPTDTTKLIRRDTGGASSFGQVTFLTVWNYIKDKISSVLGLTVTTYGGKASTAGNADTVNSHTVNADVPSGAKFTDTVTTATTTGSGNAVTAISASNGALTVTKGSTFLTSFTETDPTVPSWAKAASKPSYTAAEVGLGNVDNTADADKTVSQANELTTGRRIDGVGFKGNTNITHQADVNLTTVTNNTMAVVKADLTVNKGAVLYVTFTNSSAFTNGTGTTDASTFYMTVNGGSSRSIYYRNNSSPTGITLKTSTAKTRFRSNNTYGFIYDGVRWWITTDFDSNTTYTSGTDAELTAGTVTSTRVWTPKILHDYIASHGGSSATTLTVTLSASGWSNGTQTVTATGVTASNNVIVSPAPASYMSYGASGIYCSAQASNSLTFTCASVPGSAITVNVLIM